MKLFEVTGPNSLSLEDKYKSLKNWYDSNQYHITIINSKIEKLRLKYKLNRPFFVNKKDTVPNNYYKFPIISNSNPTGRADICAGWWIDTSINPTDHKFIIDTLTKLYARLYKLQQDLPVIKSKVKRAEIAYKKAAGIKLWNKTDIFKAQTELIKDVKSLANGIGVKLTYESLKTKQNGKTLLYFWAPSKADAKLVHDRLPNFFYTKNGTPNWQSKISNIKFGSGTGSYIKTEFLLKVPTKDIIKMYP